MNVNDTNTLPPGYICAYNCTWPKSCIVNLAQLPNSLREVIDKCERLDSRGHRELIGYIGRQAVLSLCGHWEPAAGPGTDDRTACVDDDGNELAAMYRIAKQLAIHVDRVADQLEQTGRIETPFAVYSVEPDRA